MNDDMTGRAKMTAGQIMRPIYCYGSATAVWYLLEVTV